MSNQFAVLKQIGIGLLRVVLAVVIGSIVGAVLFAGIDWMRTFQSDTIASSISRDAIQGDSYSQITEPALLYAISKFVDWYSTVFFGYSRFGAGLFMLAGTFWALGQAKSYSIVARALIGFFAGVLMGARVAMFVLSKPILVLVIAVISGFIGAGYLILAGRKSSFESLPKLQFKHQN
jgi:hypothetical protein